jgi:hypothetical protein
VSTLPRAILSDTIRSLLSGRRVTAGVFMTYTFEPQFFEEEVLSLLSDEMVSAEPKLRILQLEELLRSSIGSIAVYYDRGGLRGDGAARLDVRYTPVHLTTGVFHPKIVLLLTESDTPADSKTPPSLICGILSANLTKSGWWSNLECGHFEVVQEDQRCSYREDLLGLLKQVRALGDDDVNHEALDSVHDFVSKKIRPMEHATLSGRLRPRIMAGTGSLTAFLSSTRGDRLAGKTLEVISPFFDDHRATPLRRLMTELALARALVFLPRNAEGVAACSATVYDDVVGMDGAEWAKFRGEDALLRLGKDKHAKVRSVHAKVYRFTDRANRYEALIVGSHNLTSAATSKGGNFEASFFLETEPESRVEPWLETDDKKPKVFNLCDPALQSSMPRDDAVVPLQVKFGWTKPRSCRLLWEGAKASPGLRLSLRGAEVMSCGSLLPNRWWPVSDDQALAIEGKLVSSALLTVQLEGGDSGTILVQEDGMSRKPSILLTLSPTEILAYWARLTVDQRVQYLEERLGGIDPSSLRAEGFELLERESATSMFETYAGIFHGFEMLREQVSKSLADGREKHADYLLFGDRHDSLPRLLHRVVEDNEQKLDAVSRYLMVLSARQMVKWLKRERKEFVSRHSDDMQELDGLASATDSIRAQLSVGSDHVAFLDWFDAHFMRRQRQAQDS